MKLWNSGLFYSETCPRNRHGKKEAGEKQFDRGLPSPSDNPNPTQITNPRYLKQTTPTKRDFNQITKRNAKRKLPFSVPLFGYFLKSTTPRSFEDSLKFAHLELKTRGIEKSRLLARGKQYLTHKGKTTRRTIKRVDTIPPNYHTVKIPPGFTYRFYFYDISKRKTVTRDKSNNKPRVHPTRTETRTYQITNKTIRIQDALNLLFEQLTDAPRYPTGKRIVKIPLTLTKIIQIKPIKTVIWRAELKPRFEIRENPTRTDNPTRNNAENMIVIDYARLFKAEKRISKKWFALLVDSLKDESLIPELTPHLKKLRSKIITSVAHPTDPIKKRTLKPRRATVKAFNENLAQQATDATDKMRDRKRAQKIKRLLIA